MSAMGQAQSNVNNILVTDTTAFADLDPEVRAIYILSDATFTTLTGNMGHNSVSTIATGANFGTVTAGTIIYGKFTDIQLATGSAILYR